ncbi:hypothetical protein ACTXT7_006366 [Hymenolepis weldensis]
MKEAVTLQKETVKSQFRYWPLTGSAPWSLVAIACVGARRKWSNWLPVFTTTLSTLPLAQTLEP